MASKARNPEVPPALAGLLAETKIPVYRRRASLSSKPIVVCQEKVREEETVDLIGALRDRLYATPALHQRHTPRSSETSDTVSSLDDEELSAPLQRPGTHGKVLNHTPPVDLKGCQRRISLREICMEHPLEHRECHVDPGIIYPKIPIKEEYAWFPSSLSKGLRWAARSLKTSLALQDDYLSGSLLRSLPVIEGVERRASIIWDDEIPSSLPLWDVFDDKAVISASVQMQTWPQSLPSHTVSDGTILVVRPREPRLNGDFLRLACLEMEMRRIGKIEDVSKARFVLAPRKDSPLAPRRRLQEL